ncbi:alpha/beta hydrolase [Kamptonema cortianum]|nr:alpha/beta hydrolase [Oscillatoria laete-virens]MDK3159576.1 alpha/beta hydrolase [Kamptonema cortianum]MDL5053288.1 alpha/beta hydrolase [Oscillatoria laete-virens NRMC-F 0139]
MFGEIRNQQGEKLDYTFHKGGGQKQIVVIGHGVTGNKDRPFVVALGEALEKAGVNALRFSFSGNGASEGKFTDSTISKEVADLGAVLDALEGYQIIYVGHSMGGAVGVLRTSADSRVNALVSLAGMVYTADFYRREFGMVKAGEGFMWDEETCPLSQAYVDDMLKIDNVLAQGAQIKVPWLLVHGTEDDVVPPKDSEDIFARANCAKELVTIPGANHVFAGDHTAPMVDKVVSWVKARFA